MMKNSTTLIKVVKGIGAFGQNKLRIIDANCNFIEREEEEDNRTVFNEDIKLKIERKEAIATKDASVKDANMAGVWKIEEDYEFNRSSPF